MTTQVNLEIRASEGGNDSKLLVDDQLDIYIRSFRKNGFQYKILKENPGYVSV